MHITDMRRVFLGGGEGNDAESRRPGSGAQGSAAVYERCDPHDPKETRVRLTIVIALLMLTQSLHAQSCRLIGVWELVSGKTDTTPYPVTLHARKVITHTHFTVVSRDDAVSKAPKTTADTVALLQSMAGVSGTYTLRGTTYTETPDYYPDPAYVGLALPFTCRTEADQLYQSGNVPVLQNGVRVRDVKLEEVWRRIE